MRKIKKAVIKQEKTEMRNTEKSVAKQVTPRVIVKVRKAICGMSNLENSSSGEELISNEKGNICRGCGGNYYKIKLMEEWLQCVLC